jgi:hypothetical protein
MVLEKEVESSYDPNARADFLRDVRNALLG